MIGLRAELVDDFQPAGREQRRTLVVYRTQAEAQEVTTIIGEATELLASGVDARHLAARLASVVALGGEGPMTADVLVVALCVSALRESMQPARVLDATIRMIETEDVCSAPR